MTATDERDEALGAALERAVRRVDPGIDPARVVRKGARRRLVRGVAAMLVVSLFVAGVAWAAVDLRRQRAVTLGSLETDGWTLQLPAGWHEQTIEACPDVDGGIGDGVIATNAAFTFTDPDGGPPSCEDRFVFDGFPEEGAALSIEPIGRRPGTEPHDVGTPFPLDRRLLTPTDSITGGPSMSYIPIWVDGSQLGTIRVWVGSDAGSGTAQALDGALASIDVRGAAHWASGEAQASGPGTVSYRYPDDWTAAAGSWPLTFVSAGAHEGQNCTWGDNPGDLGSGAVLFVSDEIGTGPGPAPPPADRLPRPDPLTWSSAESVDDDARCGGEPMTRGVWRFELGGRDVSVFLAMGGPSRDETAARAAWSIVESLTFSDALPSDRSFDTVGESTTMVDEGDAFSVTYPSDWHLSDVSVNTWVSSPYEILAVATYPLRPGGHAVTDGQVPSNAMDDLGPDDVFIWVSDGGDSAGFPPRPTSLETPCVGRDGDVCEEPTGRALGIPDVRAWWTYFGDRGRGIYLFVAMGEDVFRDPVRSTEAWTVVDSLRFQPR